MTPAGTGNVGIGTTTPTNRLQIEHNASAFTGIRTNNYNTSTGALTGLYAQNDRASGVGLFGTAGSGYTGISVLQDRAFIDANSNLAGIVLNNEGADPIIFSVSNAEKMRVHSDGNVGIGKTVPGSKLTVLGGDIAVRETDDGNNAVVLTSDAADGYATLYSGGSAKIALRSSGDSTFNAGNFGVGTTTALGDQGGWRYKMHVQDDYNSSTWVAFTNMDSGTAAAGGFLATNGSSINEAIRMQVNSTGFTTTGGFIQDAGMLVADTNLSGGLVLMARNSGGYIRFFTNGHTNERLTIASDGGVGVNDTTPTEGKLTVGGTFYVLTNTAVGADPLCWDGSGGSLYGDCTSLREYKTNIKDLGLGIDAVLALTPRTFTWKEEFGGEDDLGFIAEEVADVDPLLARYDSETGALQGVKYERLTALLVKAFQEIVSRIDALEAQLAAVGDSVSTTLANFVEVVTHKLTTDELCIGDTCIDEDQLKELLENANVLSAPPADEPPPSEEPPVEETPPTEEPPADEPPAEDPPPADEPPAEELPVEETPVDEPPADESPSEEDGGGGGGVSEEPATP